MIAIAAALVVLCLPFSSSSAPSPAVAKCDVGAAIHRKASLSTLDEYLHFHKALVHWSVNGEVRADFSLVRDREVAAIFLEYVELKTEIVSLTVDDDDLSGHAFMRERYHFRNTRDSLQTWVATHFRFNEHCELVGYDQVVIPKEQQNILSRVSELVAQSKNANGR